MNLRFRAQRHGFAAATVLCAAALTFTQGAAFSAAQASTAEAGNGESRSAAQFPFQVISLVNVQSGRCLDIPNSNTNNGTPMEIYDCNGGSNQQWQPQSNGQPTSLISRASNYAKCLDVNGGSVAPGTRVVISDCNNTESQEWQLQSDGTIQTVVPPGLCLDLAGSTANGGGVRLWYCDGRSTQQWKTR
ncbi:RICIN domain-containing protein [Streptomyces sp. NPDC020379]|uniref:RICIN domain-containing protein n=1 Tax=Streptomyces sp. NPDC020379 TaxID=3365071 RepID=UPI00379C2CC7